MSHTNRNFIIAYILLVGFPLLGLAGIMRVGRHLPAPMSVDGTWRIEADSSHLAGQPCSETLSSMAHSSLVISQSGKDLQLSFSNAAKTAGSGVIEGKTLTAATVPVKGAPREAGCGEQGPVLTASVDPKSEPRTLTGELTVAGCPACAPVQFHAMRQPRPATGGTH